MSQGQAVRRAESGELGRVLVVDDTPATREALAELLGGEGYEVETAASGEEALELLRDSLFDVVLLDLNLPGMHGLNVLAAAPATQTDAAFLVMTGSGEVDSAVEAMKAGALDYLVKPLDPDPLLSLLRRAVRDREARRRASRVGRAREHEVESRFVGAAPSMRRLFELIDRVGPTRTTVLLEGETGVGKELAARAIHDRSPRARGPFVPVHCSAIPESLLESELLGHVKGSFTGAVASRKGLFEEAHGGTLFLDEISTIAPDIQVKLLRVLEERAIRKVGGNRPVPVDFRLVAATNVDLGKEVDGGRFRQDLYYRLHVFPIRVPPLRERRQDIPLLAEHFRSRFARQNRVTPPAFSADTLRRMVAYEWPGNVRELENYVERAMILFAGAPDVRFDPASLNGRPADGRLLEEALDRRWTLAELERRYMLAVLREADGNRSRTAEVLGVSRRTVSRKLKAYGTGDVS